MSSSDARSAARKCEKLGLHETERMLLFCLDRKTAKCASSRQMMASWKYLKKRLKELKLEKHGRILRVKTGCIGVCKGGPLMAVVPDGIWYGQCTPDVIEQILQEHLLAGNVVEKYVISSGAFEQPVCDSNGF